MCEFAVKVILSDIEGTTSSISFVRDTLFPYAAQHTEQFLTETWNDLSTQAIINVLLHMPPYKDFVRDTGISTEDISAHTVSEYVKYLMDMDVKLASLKDLQGLVWSKGYETGAIIGHVYSDVPVCLKKWQDMGIRLAIYSSGSIKAQKLLFGRTDYGNLLPYISAHFDTTSGHKQEVKSYENISKVLNVEPSDILFLTDVAKEAEAAQQAGYKAVLLTRPGNAPLTEDDKNKYCIVNDFEKLQVKLK